MTTRNDLAAEALHLFNKFNCAQSSLVPFVGHFELSREMALKIATPFGGGIAKSGQVCGAVSGAIMAIGLARGTITGDVVEKEACRTLTQTFITRFLTEHGDLTCPGLLEKNSSKPGEKINPTPCSFFVRDAVLIAAELLGFDNE